MHSVGVLQNQSLDARAKSLDARAAARKIARCESSGPQTRSMRERPAKTLDARAAARKIARQWSIPGVQIFLPSGGRGTSPDSPFFVSQAPGQENWDRENRCAKQRAERIECRSCRPKTINEGERPQASWEIQRPRATNEGERPQVERNSGTKANIYHLDELQSLFSIVSIMHSVGVLQNPPLSAKQQQRQRRADSTREKKYREKIGHQIWHKLIRAREIKKICSNQPIKACSRIKLYSDKNRGITVKNRKIQRNRRLARFTPDESILISPSPHFPRRKWILQTGKKENQSSHSRFNFHTASFSNRRILKWNKQIDSASRDSEKNTRQSDIKTGETSTRKTETYEGALNWTGYQIPTGAKKKTWTGSVWNEQQQQRNKIVL